MFDVLPLLILYKIWEYAHDKIRFTHICRRTFHKCKLHEIPFVPYRAVDLQYNCLNLTSLDLSRVKFAYSLEAFANLQYLDISYTRITQIPQNLTTLICVNNRNIENIMHCTRLQYLNFIGTKLTEYPGDPKTLICSRTPIKRITSHPFICKIASTYITEIPPSVVKLNCRATSVHDLSHCTNLRKLNMTLTRVKYVPHTVTHLHCSGEIDISHLNLISLKIFASGIKHVPDNLVELRCEETYKLRDISNCTNLQYLHLHNCKIHKIPPSVTFLDTTYEVDVSHLNLIYLNTWFSNITYAPPTLQILKCDNYVDISRCTQLRELYMQAPEIKYIPPSVTFLNTAAKIDFMPNLRVLHIEDSFHDYMLPDTLEELYACDSKITNIEHCTRLKRLNISDTQIQQIPLSVEYLWHDNVKLDLRNHNLKCNFTKIEKYNKSQEN